MPVYRLLYYAVAYASVGLTARTTTTLSKAQTWRKDVELLNLSQYLEFATSLLPGRYSEDAYCGVGQKQFQSSGSDTTTTIILSGHSKLSCCRLCCVGYVADANNKNW